MYATKQIPACGYCGREFGPGGIWPAANYCRAAYLLPIIEAEPGLSAWELAQRSGIPYSQVTTALARAREWQAVTWEAEERENGGQRFRYRVAEGWREVVDGWAVKRYI